MPASSVQNLEALVINVRKLASDDSYKAIANILDEIPQLKAQIQSKDAELDHLKAEINSLKTTHANRVQENLDIYCTQRGKLEGEKDHLSREISTLTANIEQRDVAAAEHHQLQKELRGQLDLANKSVKEEKKKLVAANADIKKLREDLKGKDTGIEKLKESLHNQMGQVTKVKSQLENLLKQKTSLQQELQLSTAKLSEIEGFTTNLHDEEDAMWIDQLDRLWESASRLIESLFKEDLAEECLRDTRAWKDFRDLPHLDRVIPLPQSNSPAAKQMRIAAMLSVLARCINLHLFKPAYLFDDESEIRGLLVRLAVANSKKESFCRASLLSIFPEDQARNAAEAVERVIREVSWSIRKLISDAQFDRFKLDLEKVVHQARDTWQLIQCTREKFEAYFELRHYDEIEWQPLRFDDRIAVAGKKNTLRASERDDALLVIFPRIYVVADDEPDPVTSGVVLTKSQSAAAAEEIETKHPSSPTTGRPGPRSKAIRSRTKSISINGGNNFLSRATPSSVYQDG